MEPVKRNRLTGPTNHHHDDPSCTATPSDPHERMRSRNSARRSLSAITLAKSRLKSSCDWSDSSGSIEKQSSVKSTPNVSTVS
eukprot:2525588-Prymnesium_polylepis.1